MNDFKRANNVLTYAQIINEYNEKVENAKYALKIKIISLRKALEKKPDKIKQAQLELLLNIREELK